MSKSFEIFNFVWSTSILRNFANKFIVKVIIALSLLATFMEAAAFLDLERFQTIEDRC